MENEKKNNILKQQKSEALLSYVDKFLYYEEVLMGKSYNTIRSYKRDLLQFAEYLFKYEKIYDFEQIEMMTFRSFIMFLNSPERKENKSDKKDVLGRKKEIKPVSKRSINRKISALRTFFKYLQEIKVVKTNKVIYINMPKFEKELPDVINRDELQKLRNVIDTSKILGLRDRLIIELLYSSGLRSVELINLSEYMVDIEEREIRVIGKGGKERFTFFSETAKKWLIKYIAEKQKQYKNYTPDAIIVNSKGRKLTTRSLRRLISGHAKNAGIEKEITPHVFRHSFAVELLNKGIDMEYLQELLGHSSLSTTQMYTHVNKNLLRDIYMNTHPLAKK
ncbi:tyrosine-type recombinase/integrase [Leptotrichia sp. oral taxon 498]|uniref:tyrosine-type recombinase/integrase n=1 Tax=Leptotrichia sp. oral taxon 498 TaxID=712368 RepID=UPI000B8C8FE5|nr:tyrosine-type recombinase/integrase [Leptotrichia sp. oral taxon 498]